MLYRFAMALAALLSLALGPALAVDNLPGVDRTGALFSYRAACSTTNGVTVCIPLNGVALPDGTQVTVGNGLPVKQDGSWTFGLSGPIPAGSNVIGAVTQSGNWLVRLQDGTGTALTSTSGLLNVNITGGGGAGSVTAGAGTASTTSLVPGTATSTIAR